MPRIIPPLEQITPQVFKETFKKIVEFKKKAGITPILDNPPDLFDRAKLYGPGLELEAIEERLYNVVKGG